VEGCVRALGQRYVLRFATRIDNLGTTDYYIGSPSSQPQMFSYNNCHGHAHYEGYADYILFDQTGNAIPVGFKNGFCVIDVGCYPGGTGQFGCSNMGISKSCYDEYGTGTTCNWIDITDVPNGTYTLVVRTNWQHAPDALGRHEMNYANNYAQACINITRNAQNVPSFTQVTDCPTWTDCLGQAYGDARLDCNGLCNGPTKRGDLTGEGQQNQADAMEYVSRMLGNDINPTTCNDLNADAAITVTDACLMVNAYTRQATHDATGHVLHYHPWMDFPRGWVSIDDQVELSLGNLNPVAKTVDVLIRNPSARIMGYEFTMSGITIQSASNLAPNLVGDISLNTTLGGNKVIGISYSDSSLVKNSGFVPLARITYLTLTGAEICISSIADIVNADANNVIASITNGCLAVPNTVALRPKAWLEGPFDAASQPPLMRDDLRAGGYLPVLEPYTALNYPHINGGGGEQIGAGVLGVSGANAIVDFVVVELRSAITPAQVVATRSALLQRDGDVVGMDGTSPVLLQAPPGNYHVAIRHRNHLGAMTASPLAIGTNPLTVDFRAGETATYGTEARKSEDGTMKLWAGNAAIDNRIMYVGNGNDRDPILVRIGGAVPTGIVSGYHLEDVNLSGTVKYTGAANDRDPILVNIGGMVPTNTRLEQLP
ncbi:MAG TPA: lysyl oxidase family protein, partial [Flavobacteriales bacterium]|nr:lysyl oxidase family protein [Flavobacteriales bacterium]